MPSCAGIEVLHQREERDWVGSGRIRQRSENLSELPADVSIATLDLTTPAGRAMAGLLAVFAEFEREILRERVRDGLAHARQQGKRLGPPPGGSRMASPIGRRAFEEPAPHNLL
ncbi:MAG: recombinase family protein [Bryobacteraceae bacterium]